MQLLDEIIELAVDDKTSLAVLLRKCTVLSYRLGNERLKAWAEKELNGYADDDPLPDYRQTPTLSKGVFFGSYGSRYENYPIPTVALKEQHRAKVDKEMFRAPIAAFQLGPQEKNGVGVWKIPWPPNLVAMYQTAFFEGSYILADAWQEVPVTFFVALNDKVRNRILKFALELRKELGSVGDDPAALAPDRVDQTVVANIFGGHVVIAGRVGEVAQAENIVVVKGDLRSLADALARFGVTDQGDLEALKNAIADDRRGESSPSLGQRTRKWIQGAALKLASKGGDAALEVAKSQITAELTRLVSQFLGLQ
jgi:hypothetical protein